MRTLIILNSEKPDYAFLNIVKYWILSRNEIAIYDVASMVNEEIKSFLNHEIHLYSRLEEAIIEYYQVAFCAYNTLPVIRNINIFIFSYYLNNSGKDFLNIGADFLFVSKGSCICDSPHMETGAPSLEECSGCTNSSQRSSKIYETIYNTIFYLNHSLFIDMNFPLSRKFHYDKLETEIKLFSPMSLEEIKNERIKHFIRAKSNIDHLSKFLCLQTYIEALNEIIANKTYSINEILKRERVIIYFLIKQNPAILEQKQYLDFIYQTYIRNELYDALDQLADKNKGQSLSYYFVKSICAYKKSEYDICITFYEKYFKIMESCSVNDSIFKNEKYFEMGRNYYYSSQVKINLCSLQTEELVNYLKPLSDKNKSIFYKEIVNKGTELLNQGRLSDCQQACAIYHKLYSIFGKDLFFFKNNYHIYKNLGKIYRFYHRPIASTLKHLLCSICFFGIYCTNIKNTICDLKIRTNFSKFAYRSKKYIKRKRKALFSRLHIHGKNERRLLKYKNNFSGKRCFIIGNGPSLRISDLEKMKENGDYCFACNKIYKVFDKTSWRPNFYACIDSAVFRQNYFSILKRIKCQKFFGINLPMQDKIKDDPHNISINYATKSIEKTKFNPNGTFIYSGGTVTYVLITLAWLMGFREMYLVGCDHSYGFFSNQTSQRMTSTAETNKDYFMKNYMRPGEKINVGNLDRSKAGYLIAKNYIETHGGKIFNATRGGKLEVFTRASLDEILNKKS